MNLTIKSLTNYTIGDLIHESDRTVVYRGETKADGEPVIIKLMRNSFPSFNELVQFRNQYTIARNLEIEGIVKPLALERHQNGYALIMPDFGGISLAEYYQDLPSKTSHISQFLDIAIQITEILYQLHQNRIIHKDIKPANILINQETKRVKIIDFSISSLLPKETQTIQTPNVLEGTLAYISPEQTGRMNRGIDYRTDFYSLGVTLFEMLNRKLPFATTDPMELLHCHLAKMPILGRKEEGRRKKEEGRSLGSVEPTPNPSQEGNFGGVGSKLNASQEGNVFRNWVSGAEIPQMLIEIVFKLMAKNAEDRYQSALGLKYDLEKCREEWQETREIESFELGERDISDRFLIPEKLYGREAEVQTLLDAFVRVASPQEKQLSNPHHSTSPSPHLLTSPSPHLPISPSPHLRVSPSPRLLLVAGFSGIGKTAVVNEVHKPIVRQKGYFIKGKFDQFNRNIPFSALVQSLRDLMTQILSESDTQLQQWKNQILDAVGVQGQVIIEVIPELEKIIGKQPAVPELSGSAAQNRFNLLFGKFIQVFTKKEHPLVIFLDDLQWADSASLNLMKLLMLEASNAYLLMIGAYRDNEVFPAHPLMLTLDEMRKAQATINTITLAPLSEDNINNLVADTLSCNQEVAKSLTELVYQKTKGNPFFTTQFLLGLYEDNLISFNQEVGYWECDIAEVKQRALTDDVVEFMAARLQKLPSETIEVLKLAACIGNQFDLATLAIVCKQSAGDTATSLWKALQEGFILPQSQVYKFFQEQKLNEANNDLVLSVYYRFLHDRVQQAAYSLIPENLKKRTHLQIGRLLLNNISEAEQEEKIFDIVNQLNYGVELLTEDSERTKLANLNLIAGRKAKYSTAHNAAVNYLEKALILLGSDSWNIHYNLTQSINIELLESEYLISDFDIANSRAEEIIIKLKSVVEKVKVYEIQIQFYIVQAKQEIAINKAITALKLLDIELPNQQSEIIATTEKLQKILAEKIQNIESLINLPVIKDYSKLAAMSILTNVTPAVLHSDPVLLPLVVFKMVNITINFGNCPQAAFAYAWYGALSCGRYHNFDLGYQFGQLALKVLNKFYSPELEVKVINLFNVFVRHWQEHLQAALNPLKDSIQNGIEAGNIEFSFYNVIQYCSYLFFSGEQLEEVKSKQEVYLVMIEKYKLELHGYIHQIWIQLVRNLCCKPEQYKEIIVRNANHQDLLPLWQKKNKLQLCFYLYCSRTISLYFHNNYSESIAAAIAGDKYAKSVTGMLYVAEHNFYYSLGLLAQANQLDVVNRENFLQQIQEKQEKMAEWASYAPMNFQHKYNLVEAEKNRFLGNKLESIELYDKAIAGAKENEYIQEEALANELFAKFYLDLGKEKYAALHMQEAYFCYARWGAKAKTDDLEKRYPQLLRPILERATPTLEPLETLSTLRQHSITSTHSSTTSLNNTLDLANVLKASQAISGIIELNELLRQLTQIILQYSGGDRCALILPNSQDKWCVQAIATPEETEICCQPLENNPNVPTRLIQYVKNTQEIVVVNDLKTDLPVIGEYLLRNHPKSLLCLPILNQRHLIGILYLKNLLVSGVFTRERVLVLNFLCTQAAIALENARLYEQSQAYSQKLEESQLQIVQYEKMASLGNLMAGVAHEINNPLGFLNGSIDNAQENIHDILEHLKLYQLNYPDATQSIQENADEIDLDYLYEDIPKLLSSMENATDRIKNLCTSLRTFSRADKEHKVMADIHQGLDSTLMILKYRLKANQHRPEIQVIKDYGNFTEVECFPGELNQVFMNIIANGIDVFDEVAQNLSYSDIQAQPQRITIKTALRTKRNVVKIMIEDNGKGMPPEVKAKIFDHLFTTKGVGKGTGLGLAIVRQIVVEKHGGTIDCVSELGKGTRFIITLPLS